LDYSFLKINKNKSRPISRILYSPKRTSVIYLMRPTLRHRAGSPQSPVYTVLQHAGRTAIIVTNYAGELLPHLLTLIPTGRDGYFLLRYHTFTDIFSFRSASPFVVRTFLPVLIQSDRATCFAAKIQNF